ncbi:Flavin reductase (DIM6/NTAB) family NADH-FMN oxidoreductase RutF [Methylocaldum szegediense]|uniref:Flavin reductase (DIM6/NTAB) family NADH-FMN oxidoreductase RutF n=2 Tax=Methylocaldum szegediense TaxID=73780 RepID=A0ABM9I4E6_9GAMM|nr:Flavin reductase (DIM6/NTAB) family NADH-FMN oxidoreductase RutF [Methylocaldum szegediense]
MSQAMADLFKRITCGVYVVGVAAGDRHNAFTAAWVMPVSFDPLLLALSINPRHSSYELLKRGGSFSVNVLSREQMDLAGHFGKPADADKLASVKWRKGRRGTPLLTEALAWFECDLIEDHPAGDHVLVLGRVIDGSLLKPDAEPLTYRETGDMDGAAAIFPDRFS